MPEIPRLFDIFCLIETTNLPAIVRRPATVRSSPLVSERRLKSLGRGLFTGTT